MIFSPINCISKYIISFSVYIIYSCLIRIPNLMRWLVIHYLSLSRTFFYHRSILFNKVSFDANWFGNWFQMKNDEKIIKELKLKHVNSIYIIGSQPLTLPSLLPYAFKAFVKQICISFIIGFIENQGQQSIFNILLCIWHDFHYPSFIYNKQKFSLFRKKNIFE